MTTMREIGEFGLIERLAAQVDAAELKGPEYEGFALRYGIGDDAAAWRLEGGIEVATTDTVVEGSHFTRETTPWNDLGWKAWAANVSDVASMGALPLTGVVTLGLPADLPVRYIEELYEGMLDGCHEYGTLIVGGDVVSSRDVFVSVTMNGVCIGEPLVRSAAKPGDAIAVAGRLGGSAGGLLLLQGRRVSASRASQALIEAHRRPRPSVDAGLRVVRAGLRCAMDLSDGLVADLAKMCRASGVSARIDAERVPVAPALLEAFPDEALQIALGSGEEYVLLFAGPRDAARTLAAELPSAAVIGEITEDEPGRVRVVDGSGADIPVDRKGWEHLR